MQKQYAQINEITLSNLENYPVWEYLSEDDPNAKNECTIKRHKSNSEDIKSMIIVSAVFKLHDGSIFRGYVRPEEGLSCSQPAIVTKNEKEKGYKLMGKVSSEVFPIKWDTVIRTGMIDSGQFQDSVISTETTTILTYTVNSTGKRQLSHSPTLCSPCKW